MGDTALMVKKSAKEARFYSPVILRGTLYVAAAAFGVMMKTLLEWKAQGGVPSEIDIKILWVSTAWTCATVWATYLDKTFAKFSDEKQARDKKREETELIARADQPQKLKTLG